MKAMTLRQRVHELARELGATVRISRPAGEIDVQVEAPDGYVWSTTRDVHTLCADEITGKSRPAQVLLRALWLDLYERMAAGVEKCELADCDICRCPEMEHLFDDLLRPKKKR